VGWDIHTEHNLKCEHLAIGLWAPTAADHTLSDRGVLPTIRVEIEAVVYLSCAFASPKTQVSERVRVSDRRDADLETICEI